MAITKEQFDAVKLAHPGVEIEILVHDKLPDQVIARPAKPDEWTIYRKLLGEGKKEDAYAALVAFCVLFPAKDEVQRSFDAHPALVEVWAGELAEMAGWSQGASRKKF